MHQEALERLKVDSTAEYVINETEELSSELIGDLILTARQAGSISLDLVVPLYRVQFDRENLLANGFVNAGNLTFGVPHQETYIRYRFCLRNSGDMLAVPQPVLAPSHEERIACEDIRRRMAEPLSESRLQYLASLGKQEPTPEVPDLIIEKMRADIALMEIEALKDLEVEVNQPEPEASTDVRLARLCFDDVEVA
jgi:hypothetical protein